MLGSDGRYRAIDSDGHVIEPEEVFETYLPAEFRGRAPGAQLNERGVRRFVFDGEQYPPFPDEISIRKPMSAESRIKVLDKEKIWSVMLFPSAGLGVQHAGKPELSRAVASAYVDWIADYVASYERRLLFAVPLPLSDVDWAVRQAARAVGRGARAVVVSPNPCEGRTWDDPVYDRLYAAVRDLDVPFVFHEGTGDPNTAAVDRYGIRNTKRYAFNHMISHSFEQMFAAMSVICGGVLERFPSLRILFAEAGCSWLPYWLDRMDAHFEHRILGKQFPIRMKPSEYFGRQCFVTCEPEDHTVPIAVRAVGAERILFSTDYPHFDSAGNAVNSFEAIPGLSEQDRRSILWENAVKLFRIEGLVPA
jgi:predicted TIM-barrel fold metal-dependent hydrolase